MCSEKEFPTGTAAVSNSYPQVVGIGLPSAWRRAIVGLSTVCLSSVCLWYVCRRFVVGLSFANQFLRMASHQVAVLYLSLITL